MPAVRVGLIGCGNIARSAHLPAMYCLRDRLALVAAADLDERAARSAARPWGAEAYADPRRVIEAETIADARAPIMLGEPEPLMTQRRHQRRHVLRHGALGIAPVLRIGRRTAAAAIAA